MKKIIVLLFLVTMFSGVLYAEGAKEISNADNNHILNSDVDKYEYVKAYINSLRQLSISMDRLKEENYKEGSADEKNILMMQNIKLANLDLDVAKQMILPFAGSKNELIRQSVDFEVKFLDQIILAHNEGAKIIQGLYKNLDHPEKFDQAKYMDDMSTSGALSNNAMESMVHLATEVANILRSEYPDKNGKMSILAITNEQKEDLIKELNSIYSDKVRNGLKNESNLTYFESYGAILYEVLALRGFKTIDQK